MIGLSILMRKNKKAQICWWMGHGLMIYIYIYIYINMKPVLETSLIVPNSILAEISGRTWSLLRIDFFSQSIRGMPYSWAALCTHTHMHIRGTRCATVFYSQLEGGGGRGRGRRGFVYKMQPWLVIIFKWETRMTESTEHLTLRASHYIHTRAVCPPWPAMLYERRCTSLRIHRHA